MHTEFHKLLSQNERPMKLMLIRKKLQELLCFYKCSTDLGRKFPVGELLWRGHLIQKLNKDFCLCQVGDAWVSEQKHSSFPLEVTHRLSIFYTNEEKGSHFYTFIRNTKLTASKISCISKAFATAFSVKLSNLLLIYPFF